MSRLIHLIYNSVATEPFSDDTMTALLAKARSKNAALGITGMLLHVDGCFFQVLEGPEDAVNALAETIRQDARHGHMTSIINEPIARRAFSEWTMGYANMDANKIGEVEGLNDFFGAGKVLAGLDAGRARKLLTAFKDGRWRVNLSRPVNAPAPVRAGEVSNRPVEPLSEARPPFSFAFQPIVNAATRKLHGYEALVRGDAEGTAADVLQRIPLGDTSAFDEDGRRVAIGMATRLGLKGALHLNMLPQWRDGSSNSIDTTLDTAKRCDLDASRIVLEIKHEISVSDPAALLRWLNTYRACGMRISIDDFGSGHAGLALLDHYQPEIISLSMWLVRGIEGHGPRQAILRGLVQTCSDLGIDIIAKGVETLDEYGWLRNEGIEMFQGHLFAKPGFEQLPRPVLPAEAL
jgi:blue light- and temperature-responsive anti-repressor